MERKFLYISMCLPYEKVAHAGGKIFHYYINAFAEDDKNEVTLIAKVLPSEEEFVATLNKKIRFLSVATPKSNMKKYLSYLKSINSKYNPTYKYGNTLTKEIYDQIEGRIIELKRENYVPDIIVLEWTEMLLFVDVVKKYFPKAKYVATEHDVSFLRMMRLKDNAKGIFAKAYRNIAYNNVKKRELAAIKQCDLAVTFNWKDYNLLRKNEINSNQLGVIVPYYDRFPNYERKPNNKDIIFYGAMNRVENSGAAIWFINNVLPRLADCDVRFIVVGNKPSKELLELQNERIVVTGYVEDVSTYFSKAMCLVAPLLLGAGVKIKIIEALSAGIPVLTNDIGIEGIDAEDEVHYFHCTEPEDYEQIIRKLIRKEIDTNRITLNTKKLIEEKYNLEASICDYKNRLYSLIDKQ